MKFHFQTVTQKNLPSASVHKVQIRFSPPQNLTFFFILEKPTVMLL